MAEPTSFTDTTPHCCKRTTPWFIWQQILSAINDGGVPTGSDVRVTEEGDTRVTEEGDVRVLES